jgi:hypothetical protein
MALAAAQPPSLSVEERIAAYLARSLARDTSSQRVQAGQAKKIQAAARRRAARAAVASVRAERVRDAHDAQARAEAAAAIRSEVMASRTLDLQRAEADVLRARAVTAEREEHARQARAQARSSDAALVNDALRASEIAETEKDTAAAQIPDAQGALDRCTAAAAAAAEAFHRASMRRAEAKGRKSSAAAATESSRARLQHAQGVLILAKQDHAAARLTLRPREVTAATEAAALNSARRTAELVALRGKAAERRQRLESLRADLASAEIIAAAAEEARLGAADRVDELDRRAGEHGLARRVLNAEHSRREAGWVRQRRELEEEAARLRMRLIGLEHGCRISREQIAEAEARESRFRQAAVSAAAHAHRTAEMLRVSISTSNRTRHEAEEAGRVAEQRRREAITAVDVLGGALREEEERVWAGRRRAEAGAAMEAGAEAGLRQALEAVHAAAVAQATAQSEWGRNKQRDRAQEEERARRAVAAASRRAAAAAASFSDAWLAGELLSRCRREARALAEELAERRLGVQRFLLKQDVDRTPLGSAAGGLSAHKMELADLASRSQTAQQLLLRAELEARALRGE